MEHTREEFDSYCKHKLKKLLWDHRIKKNCKDLSLVICQAWLDDPNEFVAHMWNQPGSKYAIAFRFILRRKDSNKPFGPGNVYWLDSNEWLGRKCTKIKFLHAMNERAFAAKLVTP